MTRNSTQPYIAQYKDLKEYLYFVYADKTNNGDIFYIGIGNYKRLTGKSMVCIDI